MQTTTEYIFEQLEEQGLIFLTTKTNEMTISISASDYLDIKRLAKEMEKQQHGKTWDTSLDKYEVRAGNYMRAYEDFDDYFAETYGSKGSDATSSQTEISDGEIEKAFTNASERLSEYKEGLIDGAKWYRKQLNKNK